MASSAFPVSSPHDLLLIVSAIGCVLISTCCAAGAGIFNRDVEINWGDGRGKISSDGKLLSLSLDKASGSGFQSKNHYLFGKIDVQMKLVPGNSAGTVTTFYLSSQGSTHDEIDFEFLGNETGQPYTLHTNVYSQGKGNREQQFRLWFDPTKDFHTYSILWNPRRIIFYVDATPIREFVNMESMGIPFPKTQPMRIYSSLWNADDWATQGGRVKTDWNRSPFIASYRNLDINGCIWSAGKSSCQRRGPTSTGTTTKSSSTTPPPKSLSSSASGWLNQQMDATGQERMRWVQRNYMIYNYCSDAKRFPQGFPKECNV